MQYINDNYHCLSQGPSSSTADGPMEQAAASLNLLYVKVFLKYVPFHRKCKLFFADSAFMSSTPFFALMADHSSILPWKQ